jgi:hypothetical protein
MSMRYVGRWIPKSVPAGRVLVHNHVRHDTATRPGVNGFRAWTEEEGKNPRLTPCPCGWSGLAHYRVRLAAPE